VQSLVPAGKIPICQGHEQAATSLGAQSLKQKEEIQNKNNFSQKASFQDRTHQGLKAQIQNMLHCEVIERIPIVRSPGLKETTRGTLLQTLEVLSLPQQGFG